MVPLFITMKQIESLSRITRLLNSIGNGNHHTYGMHAAIFKATVLIYLSRSPPDVSIALIYLLPINCTDPRSYKASILLWLSDSTGHNFSLINYRMPGASACSNSIVLPVSVSTD
jgi:hypothetical protein